MLFHLNQSCDMIINDFDCIWFYLFIDSIVVYVPHAVLILFVIVIGLILSFILLILLFSLFILYIFALISMIAQIGLIICSLTSVYSQITIFSTSIIYHAHFSTHSIVISHFVHFLTHFQHSSTRFYALIALISHFIAISFSILLTFTLFESDDSVSSYFMSFLSFYLLNQFLCFLINFFPLHYSFFIFYNLPCPL